MRGARCDLPKHDSGMSRIHELVNGLVNRFLDGELGDDDAGYAKKQIRDSACRGARVERVIARD